MAYHTMTTPKKKEDSFLDKIGTLARKKKAKEGRKICIISLFQALDSLKSLSCFFGMFVVGGLLQHSKYGRALKKILT